ncbi:MAG: hypothetical protein HN337_03815 [Deltaproteobacteria bacterium]|nr:hypothetical protein [Deltaproteobacteria bacterium]
MIWFVAVAAVALLAGGCNSSSDEDSGAGDVRRDARPDGDADVNDGDSNWWSDAGIDQDDGGRPDGDDEINQDGGRTDGDGGFDQGDGIQILQGCNTQFFKPGCKVTDIDAHGKTVAIVCSDLVPGDNNKKFFLGDVGDPMQPHHFTDLNATLNSLSANYYGGQSGIFSIVPQQIQRGSVGLYDGEYYTLFAGNGPVCLSGVTFNIDGSKYTSTLDDYVYPALNQEYPQINYWRPCEVGSSLITQGSVGYKMWFPAAVESAQNKLGILRVYDLPPDTPYEFFDKDGNHEIILLSGKEPTAIAKVPTVFYDSVETKYDFAAILNSKGFGAGAPSYGAANASIDIVRLNHLEPDIAVHATIDLGASQVFPMKELPVTSDGRYAVVVGSVGVNSALKIIDMEKMDTVGTLEDSALNMNDVTDVVVKDDTVYVASNGEIRMYDISDPEMPIRKEEGGQDLPPISVGAGLGNITVDEDGIIYAVTNDPDDPDGQDSAVYAIDPYIVTDQGCME